MLHKPLPRCCFLGYSTSRMSDLLPRGRIINDPYGLAATWFGVGLSPKAPGTVGSVVALPFAMLIHYFMGGVVLLLFSAVLFFVGIKVSDLYMERFSRTGDPKEVVIDEVAGMCLSLALIGFSVEGYIFGFIMFRAFDIFKPWPISWADRELKGGLGVMMDDILAAVATIAFWWLLVALGVF